MIIVTFILVVAVFLTYLDSKGKVKNGMLVAFCLLIAFFSLRVNYGNDYKTYLEIFNHVNDPVNHWTDIKEYEVGWLTFNRLLGPFGFHCLLFVHLILILAPFYILTKRYVPQKYWWLSMFLVCFNPSLLILDLSMLRQSMAQSFCLLAVDSMLLSKKVRTLFFSALAILFHTSSIVFIPFIFIKWLFKIIKPIMVLAVLVAAIFILSTNEEILMQVFTTVRSNELVSGEYGNYAAIEAEGGSGYGVLLQFFLLLPAFFSFKKLDKVDFMLIIFYLFSFTFIPFSKVMVLVLRLSTYFSIYSVFLIPRLISKCQNRYVNMATFLMLFVYFIYSYIEFFYSATYGAHFMNYTFVFE